MIRSERDHNLSNVYMITIIFQFNTHLCGGGGGQEISTYHSIRYQFQLWETRVTSNQKDDEVQEVAINIMIFVI